MNRILVIEDEPDIQEVLRNYLQASGYAVLVAGDGEEGLTVFQKEAVDLVLLDVMLPKVDGFTALERIRKISGTPVILVTARDSVEDQVKGFDWLQMTIFQNRLICRCCCARWRRYCAERGNVRRKRIK